jgi:hypothetical protein
LAGWLLFLPGRPLCRGAQYCSTAPPSSDTPAIDRNQLQLKAGLMREMQEPPTLRLLLVHPILRMSHPSKSTVLGPTLHNIRSSKQHKVDQGFSAG